MVSLTSAQINVDIALYCEKGKGIHLSGYLAEDGSFVGSRFERLGGLGVFQVSLGGNRIKYKFGLFDKLECPENNCYTLRASSRAFLVTTRGKMFRF